MGSETFQYQGRELDMFAHAKRWKAYWASNLRKWVYGDVLEVGAGLGVNTILLQNHTVRSWHCLEPDAELGSHLNAAIANLQLCSATRGTIRSMTERRFDSILYIDVLEHIASDHDEIAMAAGLLRPGGHIIVLSPAHQFLFSNFDASIGHYRRYNRRSLRACSPSGCNLETIFYLDCVGVFMSLANRILLRQSTPTLKQIQTWDSHVVRISQFFDPLLGYRFGKTIVGVWTRC